LISHGHVAEISDLMGFHAVLLGEGFLTFCRIAKGKIVQGDLFVFLP
jgi:hypothetical protein